MRLILAIYFLFRLIAEKINKIERKGMSDIISLSQGTEETTFWECVGDFPNGEIKVSSSF